MANENGDRTKGKEMTEAAVKILELGANKTYLGRAYYRLAEYYNYKDSNEYIIKIGLVKKAPVTFEDTRSWSFRNAR